jgi:PAS domain S-box-containing protein
VSRSPGLSPTIPGSRAPWGTLLAAIRTYGPPVRDRAFWATQALVLAVGAGHSLLEVSGWGESFEPLEFVPVSLFLVPVIYAGLHFGLRGSLPTALWCAGLTIPNAFLWHAGIGRIGEFWQAGMVIAVGIIVGQWIDRERRARAEAEHRELARRATEERYRRLFETTADPIVLLDEAGAVQEANAAAGALLGVAAADLRGRPIEAVAGPEIAAMALGAAGIHPAQLPARAGEVTRWVEPACSAFTEESGAVRSQVILRDVTAQLARQEGLAAYARHTLATREEERRRIARDLHDGPVQSLVLLWRHLDAIGVSADPENRGRLVEARSLAEQIADDLRRFSRDLRPSVLDDLGLGPALKAEVATVSQRSGLAGRYVQTGRPRRLTAEIEMMVLRIAQEALHNIERHADASRVLVRLGYGRGDVRLTISDDGKGIGREPPAFELLSEGKLGIVGMRERARLAGGDLRVRSGPGRGTTLSVLIPASA